MTDKASTLGMIWRESKIDNWHLVELSTLPLNQLTSCMHKKDSKARKHLAFTKLIASDKG
jgi:hypothetical protein